ncbi:MAG: hypothetical protein J6T31_06265, partial [Methanobrevibacter sp.]|nr:hypothetical protein [Methanobrevibacter sp.]
AQYTNGVASSLLTIGYRCQVRVGTSAADAQVIGFVDSAEMSKQIQTQRAQVLDSIFPASIDAQAISVSGRMTGFLASPAVYRGTQTYNGGGTISLSSFNPKSEDFKNGTVVSKFKYLDFYDEKKKLILGSIDTLISTGFTITMNGGTYVKANVSVEAIDMSSGEDYESQTDAEGQ